MAHAGTSSGVAGVWPALPRPHRRYSAGTMKMDSTGMKGGMMDSSAMKADTGAMKKTP